jgi:hypothetical protein
MTIVVQNGCHNNYFNNQVWTYIFRDTVPAIFRFEDPTLLTDFFQHVVEPYITRFMDYIEYIFVLIRNCFAVSSLQMVALTSVLRLVHSSPESFGSESVLSGLLSLLGGILPRVVHLVFCVEVFTNLTTVFADPLIVNRFVELIGALADECNKQLSVPGCTACWCAARGEYFHWMVKQGRDTEAVEHFRESLTLAKEHHGSEFTQLVVAELTDVSGLENEAFATVSTPAEELLCDFIEFGEEEVRVALRPIIGRLLGL